MNERRVPRHTRHSDARLPLARWAAAWRRSAGAVIASGSWCASSALGTPGAAAEIPAAARQIYETTMSPFCPSLLLANCPSPQADSLRRAIAARASAGASRAALEADLLAAYGDVVRAAPPRHGFALAAWLTPGLVVTATGLWVTRWARHRRPGHGTRAPSPASRRPHDGGASDADRSAPAATVDATPDELATLDRLVRET